MNDETRTTIAKSLQAIDDCMDEMDRSASTPNEGEVISSGNRNLARLLEVFGVHVADVENMAVEAKDSYDQIRADKTLQYSKENPVNKAELMTKVDPEVIQVLDALRSLEHSVDVLNRKSRSIWAYLDNSRSRLSWIGKDRSNA